MSKKTPVRHQLGEKSTEYRFRFVVFYKFLLPITLAFVAYGAFVFFTNGFVFGTDFRGGMEKQVLLAKTPAAGSLKNALSEAGIQAEVETVISRKGVYIIRMASGNDEENTRLEQNFARFMNGYDAGYEIEHTRLVSGVISSENKSNAIWTSLVVIALIVAYLTLRFRLPFAISAIVAVLHDLGVMLGVALILNLEVNILTIVAVLTVFGYSVNDTIILFDRVRELRETAGEEKLHFNTMEQAVRMIFSRTVITSLTTLFVMVSLFVSTSGEYQNFALLLIVGVISGTYSSIYVALPCVYGFSKWLPAKKKLKAA